MFIAYDAYMRIYSQEKNNIVSAAVIEANWVLLSSLGVWHHLLRRSRTYIENVIKCWVLEINAGSAGVTGVGRIV